MCELLVQSFSCLHATLEMLVIFTNIKLWHPTPVALTWIDMDFALFPNTKQDLQCHFKVFGFRFLWEATLTARVSIDERETRNNPAMQHDQSRLSKSAAQIVFQGIAGQYFPSKQGLSRWRRLCRKAELLLIIIWVRPHPEAQSIASRCCAKIRLLIRHRD